MGVGRRFELDLYNDISRNTARDVHAAVSDYSGGAASSFCDLEVYYTKEDGGLTRVFGAFIEAKKRRAKSGNRCSIMSGSSDGESGLDELDRLIDESPLWGTPYVTISFNSRRPITIDAVDFRSALTIDSCETTAGPPFFDAHLTKADNISMRKPTTDQWDSSSAADADWKVILEDIGVPQRHFEPMEMIA